MFGVMDPEDVSMFPFVRTWVTIGFCGNVIYNDKALVETSPLLSLNPLPDDETFHRYMYALCARNDVDH